MYLFVREDGVRLEVRKVKNWGKHPTFFFFKPYVYNLWETIQWSSVDVTVRLREGCLSSPKFQSPTEKPPKRALVCANLHWTMQLSKVPNPLFPSVRDITLYTMSGSLAGPGIIGPNRRTSARFTQSSNAAMLTFPYRRLITGRSKVDSRLFQTTGPCYPSSNRQRLQTTKTQRHAQSIDWSCHRSIVSGKHCSRELHYRRVSLS